MMNGTSFDQAITSYTGHLVGREQAAFTIRDCTLDILSFLKFLDRAYEGHLKTVDQVDMRDIELYHDYLKNKGLKSNTRRRRILTIHNFFSYLEKRNKLAFGTVRLIPVPPRVERVPFTIPIQEALVRIKNLPTNTKVARRNRALFWVLAESGCAVSEVVRLRFEDLIGCTLTINGNRARVVPISEELRRAIECLEHSYEWMFFAYNKFDLSKPTPLSVRGLEGLVKDFRGTLGYKGLTPRTFRHSLIVDWLQGGLSKEVVRQRLGLRPSYLFKPYETLLKTPLAKAG